VYTHINFAFATIDPVSFKVLPATQADVNLYKRLMLIKRQDPDLRIFIAIGGWTFNDPGPTATTFSDIAASVPRQRVFIESLMSFMSTYGFDGVDLDWEYPAADDRSGRPVDFENFPNFMARLRDSLRPSKKGISITIPASYWYLQHFDLKALVCPCSPQQTFSFKKDALLISSHAQSKTVDWFNIM
jgi:chitinase